MASNGSRIAVTFPCLPLLTLLFIALKLCKVIAWSWWWVLAPAWIPVAVAVAVVAVVCLVAVIKD